MHICLCLFLTWKHEGTFLWNFYNIFIKVQHNFSAIFCKFEQKVMPWQHATLLLFTFPYLLSSKMIVQPITAKTQNCSYLLNRVRDRAISSKFSSLRVSKEYAMPTLKKSSKMAAILNFRIFQKSEKIQNCFYLLNC